MFPEQIHEGIGQGELLILVDTVIIERDLMKKLLISLMTNYLSYFTMGKINRKDYPFLLLMRSFYYHLFGNQAFKGYKMHRR